MRTPTFFVLTFILSGLAPGQSPDAKPSFDVAAIYISAPARYPSMHVNFRSGRLEVKTATMADLIANAWGVEADKVLGGPNWLELDRFDVIARVPPNASQQTIRLMLKSLLLERFHLTVHTEQKPMPTFVLSAGTGTAKLKRAEGSEPAGCRRQPQGAENNAIPAICRGVTMEAFARQLRTMAGDYLMNPVVDKTNLEGPWDFDLRWTPRTNLSAAGRDGINVFDAIANQLGLKLEAKQVPAPVIIVDSVDRKPMQNPPDATSSLPLPPPPQFEVATIKPADPQSHGVSVRTPASGLISIQGMTLSFLIQTIWFITPDMIAGAPKWLDTERWDIEARVAATPGSAPQMDVDSMITMVRALLEDRFKLKTHMEEKVVPAYTLTAAKPKLQKADPANRTACKEGPATGANDPRLTNPALSRLVTCRNMTMTEFAAFLPGIANVLNPLNGPIRSTVLDSTGIAGAWDFSLNFTPELGFYPGNAPAPAADGAPDPAGTLSLAEAISRQLALKLELAKRPAQVLVIDHIEPKPVEN